MHAEYLETVVAKSYGGWANCPYLGASDNQCVKSGAETARSLV